LTTLASLPLASALAAAERDLKGQSKLGLVYTDKIDGDDFNRVGGLDTRLTFGHIYSLRLRPRPSCAAPRSTSSA
jgi:hypothetical protein